MRKLLLTTIFAVAGVVTVNAATTADINLTGTIAKACNITAASNGSPVTVILTTPNAEQVVDTVTLACNYSLGRAFLKVTSINGGVKSAVSEGAVLIPYTTVVLGGDTESVYTLGQNVSVVPNGPVSVAVALASHAGIAGTYTDKLTATVTPN